MSAFPWLSLLASDSGCPEATLLRCITALESGWVGESLAADSRLLLIHEGGYGDVIQFVRFASMLGDRGAALGAVMPTAEIDMTPAWFERRRTLLDLQALFQGRHASSDFDGVDYPQWSGEPLTGRRVIVDAVMPEPLVRLIGSVKGIARVFEAVPDERYDYWVPIMGLLGPRPAPIPGPIPYLHADSRDVISWRGRLDALGPGRRVGVAWAVAHREGDYGDRALPPDRLADLVAIPGVQWISLEKDEEAEGARRLSFGDFSDAAALVENLDIVITVDTAAAHLAGALGKPVWVMLPANADWRWAAERDTSPWYPTMRLFRQESLGDWTPVIERVRRELEALDGK